MKINFSSKITTIKGLPMKEAVVEDGEKIEKEIELKDICINALLTDVPKPQNAPIESGREKFKKYNLAKKVGDGGEIEISSEEITLLKEQIGNLYPPMVVGSAYEILEGQVKE